MKSYNLIKFRVFNKEYKKIMSCRMLILNEDLTKIIEFLVSNDRIIVFDEIKEFKGRNEILEMLRKIKNEIEDENQLYFP